jgi:bifunctional UDP-N-acetylglucosamine pyrophosphorylase/glucosamine-1-phosphate N-acetyltransferase
MKAVIPAAGEGKRVKPLSINRDKAMIKLLGKPLIEYVLKSVVDAGLDDIIIVVGENGNQIKSYLGDGKKFGAKIQYTVQKEPLGTGNALQTVEGLVGDKFFVINGDDIFEPELLKTTMEELKDKNADMVLSCKPVKETWKFGIIAKNDDGKVTRIIEKPKAGEEPSDLAVVGVYLMPKEIFNHLKNIPVSDHQFEDAIQAAIDAGSRVHAVSYDGFFGSFKYPWDLFALNKYLMDKLLTNSNVSEKSDVSSKALIDGNVFIGDGVKIMEGAIIKGPCYIGAGSLVGTNAMVREYSSLGENCLVGFATEIVRSIIGDGCWFHTDYIGDSIISDNCKFGARSVTANLRFDEKNISVLANGQKVDTGMNKLGVIAGENCRVGVNCSLMPGVKIGPNSIVGAGVCLSEDLEPGKAIFVDRKSYVIKENKI